MFLVITSRCINFGGTEKEVACRVDMGTYYMHDSSLEETKKKGQVSDLRVLLYVKMSCYKMSSAFKLSAAL